jgi:hypothetical protein
VETVASERPLPVELFSKALIPLVIRNAKEVLQVLNMPGQMFKGILDPIPVAALRIQQFWKRFKIRQAFKDYLIRKEAARILLKMWTLKAHRMMIRASLRSQFENVHMKRYQRLSLLLRREWPQWVAQPKTFVVLAPRMGHMQVLDYVVGK